MKISIPFYSATGEAKDTLSLEIAERFSKLNASLISQAIYIEQNRSLIKAGKSMTKGEIRGGGRKPWKQKGTGRARAGSSRSPLWRGGGVTFGPTGINKVLELPKKMKELAFGQMLCAKIQSKELCVIESAKVKSKKTKEASDIAIKIANGKKIQLYVTKEERMDCLPWRNLGFVESNVFELIPFKILTSNQQIVVSNEVFNLIKEKLAK